MLVLLVGPTAAGKTTLIKALRDHDPSLRLVRTVSTRQPRTSESDRQLVSDDEFRKMAENGQFKWVSHLFGRYYGTSAEDVGLATSSAEPIYIMDLAYSELHRIGDLGPYKTAVMVLPPSEHALLERLELTHRSYRAAAAMEQYQKCVSVARNGFPSIFNEHPLIITDYVERAVAELSSIASPSASPVPRRNIVTRITSGYIREVCAEAERTHRPALGIPYEAVPEYEGNEFLIFLKPDILELNDRLGPVWELIHRRLEAYGVELTAATALDAEVLRRYRLIHQHYGVINTVSMEGVKALSKAAKEKLDAFLANLPSDTEVLGAHQFIDRYPMFSPPALSILYDNLPGHRFAGGTYGVVVRISGRTVVLLNGFHPEQLDLFESPGAVIMCFVGRSTRSWSDLRQNMTGATNPADANEGSIRRSLLESRSELGLTAVTSLRNGVHVSAGPVEASVEIARYFTPYGTGPDISPLSTSFGQRLQTFGSVELADALVRNDEVVLDGRLQPAFDATEERDAAEVDELVRSERLRLGDNG